MAELPQIPPEDTTPHRSAIIENKPQQAPRFDGQYLQTIMQFWTNINAIIWQQLVVLLSLQSALIIGSYSTRPSWLSVFMMMIAIVLTIALGMQIKSNMELRLSLINHANYLANILVTPLVNERYNSDIPLGFGTLYPLKMDKDYWAVRHKPGLLFLFIGICIVDILVAVLFNLPYQSCTKYLGVHCHDIEILGLHILPPH